MATIFGLSMVVHSFVNNTPFSFSLKFLFPTFLPSLLFTTLQGASGKESGWRGYLLPKMEEQYGFTKGNLILGLIWAFWHLPLWFISSGFNGLNLIWYICVFIVLAISFTILIGWFQKKCRNLFLAFWIHFLFNFFTTFLNSDILVPLTIMMCFYAITAIIILIKNRKTK